MRIHKTLLVGILGAVFGAQGCSQATDPPKQKPGLWEVAMTMEMPPQTSKLQTQTIEIPGETMNVTSKVCTDEKISQSTQLFLGAASPLGKSCTKMETHSSGSTVTTDRVCELMEGLQTKMHSVITFVGDTAFRQEIRTHTESIQFGSGDGKTVITAKWLSASCPAGMKPGDTMMPDGKTILHHPGATAH